MLLHRTAHVSLHRLGKGVRRRRSAIVVALTAFLLPAATLAPSVAWAGQTGASVLDYSQCQNGAVPSTNTGCNRWGNGILNTSNSHYAEDQVTPQRLLLSTPSGSTNTVTIRYMTRKGSANAHAYDSLATWNFTQTTANRCQGLVSTDCPSGAASTFPMASDPNPVQPSATGISNVTAAHELPQASRQWVMYGGTITAVTTPVHTTDPADTSSDYAKVTVTFRANGTRAQLLFGGHIAPSAGPRGWGSGLGAASINGGPYHIILDALNGASAGSRDNAITASAIQAGGPSFSVIKSANPTNATPGQTVTYTVTVTNNGTVSGSTTFTDDFDNRLSPSTPTSVPAGGSCTREPAGSTNRLFSCTTSVLAANGGSQTFTYTAAMPTTFGTGAGTGGCASGKFPVLNTVTLASGAQDDALVCVAAAPDLRVVKSASPATVNAGGSVTYTITITNNGSAPGSTTFTDNYDDRLSPSSPSPSPAGGSCTNVTTGDKHFECTSGTVNPGSAQTWTYTATMPTSFTGTPGGNGCNPTPPGQFPVRNVVVLANGSTDDSVVCVNATPTLTVVKSANPTTASPGQSVTYTITITNGGSAPGSTTFSDNYDDRLSPTSPSPSPAGGSCTNVTTGDKHFDCTSGTIAAGSSQTWTYTATMPTSFTGAPGGNGCNPGPTPPGQFPVRNVVVLANGSTDDAVVCVNAAPDLRVVKTANPTTANPGQSVTYTITISNVGSAPGSTTFSDNYDDRLSPSSPTASPAGGSCTNITTGDKHFDCTSGTVNPGSTQTWTYTANMPTSFTGTPGGNGCNPGPTPPGQFPVRNVVVLANGSTDDAVVCVNPTPTFTVIKSANPTTASPGQTVTYTITITNGGGASGSTTFSDNYDDRLSPSSPTASPAGGSCTNVTTGDKHFNCTSGTIAAGSSQTWTYTATMPTSFTGTPGGNGCNGAGPDQQFPVRNVVVLANGNSDDAVVCVNAAPNLIPVKSASPTTANPGQTVTYTITITNTGTAPGSTTFTDDYDNRLSPTAPTPSPAGGSCTNITTGNKRFECTSGTINPGGSQTWTYTATMPTSFTGEPGGNGCNPTGTNQQFPVRNVVVLANGNNDDAVVCVNANPNLALVKTVAKSTDAQGREVLTYTLTYSNTGAAEAPTATITETVPAGTAYGSCSNNCTTSTSGGVTTVTWTVGPIAPRTGTGFVSLTVTVTTTSACSISNTAKISAPGFNGGNPVNSNTLVTPVTPAPDPDHARASGSAIGALVTTYGLVNVTTTTISHAASQQNGVGGPSTDSETFLNANVPALLNADALRTTSSSEVTATPPRSSDTSTSEVLGLCVVKIALTCTVKADTVRAVAHAEATGTGASISATGSTIQNLEVTGVATPVDLTQTTTIPLTAAVFGSGSYVAINERTGGTSLTGAPPAYNADLTVTMIRVHITGALGVQKVDISVAQATAHADFPQLKLCGPQATQSVSGHAFVAHVAVLPPLVLATQGFVGIPASGGSEQQDLAGVSLVNGSLLTTGVATTSSVGVIGAGSSTSTSRASVADVCLLRFPNSTQCVVMASAVKSISKSTATGTASSTDAISATDKTQLLNLEVRSAPGTVLVPVPVDPPPNTKIEIPNIGFLILNEQVCDDGSLASNGQPRCSGVAHSGLTVRSLHLVLLRQFGPFNPGVEAIVSEAHSDASFS